jgi:uncharacterized protein YkwD
MKIPAILRTVSFLSLALLAALGSSCGQLGGGSGGGNHKIVAAPGLRNLGSRLREAGNSYRRSSGKSALSRHAGLVQMAQQHSESMARRGRLDHQGSASRTDEVSARYGMNAKAENVMRWHVKAGRSPQAMLKVWTDSSQHRRNLLGPYGVTGIGIAQDEQGNIWVTQIYAPDPGSAASSGMGSPAFW